MKTYICSICGYAYEEQKGELSANIAEGTVWADVPEDFVCPLCGAQKDMFEVEA